MLTRSNISGLSIYHHTSTECKTLLPTIWLSRCSNSHNLAPVCDWAKLIYQTLNHLSYGHYFFSVCQQAMHASLQGLNLHSAHLNKRNHPLETLQEAKFHNLYLRLTYPSNRIFAKDFRKLSQPTCFLNGLCQFGKISAYIWGSCHDTFYSSRFYVMLVFIQ